MKVRSFIKKPLLEKLKGRGAENGFSILEAVISLAIAGFVLTAFFDLLAANTNVTQRTKNYARAALVSQNIISRLGNEIPLDAQRQTGETKDGFSWELAIEPYASANITSQDTLYRITVNIHSSARPEQSIYAVETVRAAL